MRVGYIFNHSEIIGGGEISFIDLIDEIRNSGVDPVAIVPGDGVVARRLGALGIRTVFAMFPTLRRFGILKYWTYVDKIKEILESLNLDIVHTNGARCMLYVGPACRKAGIPCVWHVRVIERDVLLDRIRVRYADEILANSNAVATSIRKLVGRSKRISVIYNGIKIDKYVDAKPLNLMREFGLPEGPVILVAARISREKNIESIISAYGIMRKKGLICSLLLVGSPDFDEDYVAALKKMVIQDGVDNVVFTGWRDDIISIMKSASVVVLPSTSEPFGRVIIEAWACGVPVVATDSGGPAELINNNRDGVLVEPGNVKELADAIQRLASDSRLAFGLSNAGLEQSRHFSITSHAENVVALYRRMLGFH